ncbi:MAG: MmcQ/YjbR family DNA-binding protein [Chloroflexi bacterium]|nr:MAG: MmcQ/YjbR family DNA-binding protein [Chloroflexota bacterium]
MVERPSDPTTVERLRKLCAGLPGVIEKQSHGEPAWFIGGKQFATTADHHHDDRLSVWLAATMGAQEMFVTEDPQHFFRPPYVGHRGWLGVYLDADDVDWDGLAGMIENAYRLVAPKKWLMANLQDAHQRMKDAYWKDRDIATTVRIGQWGIATGRAIKDKDAMGEVKGMAYDLGSFTWPGWDEPGIELTPDLIVQGLAAAEINLAYGGILRRADLPMSRAHWLVGAHQLAAGDLGSAVKELTIAEELANKAGSKPDELLCRGYRQLAAGEGRTDYDATLAALRRLEGGEELVGQLQTAARVLKLAPEE